MNNYIFINFSRNFCVKNKVLYIEDSSVEQEFCKKNITIWFRDILNSLKEKFDLQIFHMSNKQNALGTNDIGEDFLFYSVENALDYQELLCISNANKAKINSTDDIYLHSINALIISNDYDGDGLDFYANPDSDVYLWLLKNLNLKKIEIFEYISNK